jgi:alpha-amylase/alpha-mannosidase (GH57 family)
MATSNRYLCIHGHFYQPPRENPWLEAVELQDSAAPFHDWNERINFECYAPNAAARILNSEQRIVDIVNNYARISFNFGPTLLSWMKEADPVTYARILQADKDSQDLFGGHGSALAQSHSHLILPLCNERDKVTQVAWGIQDFEHRFGRKPEGMWLAETAVDTDTLEVLAEQEIKFTILAPRQAKAIRKLGDEQWQELGHAEVDTRRPYLCRLPSGRSIALYFYHGGIAQGVAFEGLLNNGSVFANRFAEAFDEPGEAPQLVHIATDGESYGHHHRHGEMALAACLQRIEDQELASITNYGQYLAMFPPAYEVQIHDNSSWSCVHGVERWRSDCGCSTGGHPGWTQEWRAPLREALNSLRDRLIPVYEKQAGQLIKDTWAARDDYIQVLLEKTPARIDAFIARHARRALKAEEEIQLLRLMEMQRHAMLMFTSCGWFFDEVSGIETNQILQYANRAIHYAAQVSDTDLHNEFIERLAEAPSNIYTNAAESYQKYVVPARVDLVRVGMHYAVSSVFEEYPEHLELFNYTADVEVFYRFSAGKQRLVQGRIMVKSKTTRSEKHFSYAVLYLGQQNIIGNISLDMSRERFDDMSTLTKQAFRSTNLGEVIGLMQECFDQERFTISQLFHDEKRKILRLITESSQEKVEKALRDIYEDNYQLMTGMAMSDIPVPAYYQSALEFIINHDLLEVFENGNLNPRRLRSLYAEFRRWGVQLSDEQAFKLAVEERLFRELKRLENKDADPDQLNTLIRVLETVEQLDINLEFWKSQNLYFSLQQDYEAGQRQFETQAVEQAFKRMGTLLSF